jgi:hypothetical protein
MQVGRQRGAATADQSAVEKPRRRSGFAEGKSGNPSGWRLIVERRTAMMADLERELGGPIIGTDRVLAERAVELLTKKPRSHDEAVRMVNAGTRVLNGLRDKYARHDKSARPDEQLADWLRATQRGSP